MDKRIIDKIVEKLQSIKHGSVEIVKTDGKITIIRKIETEKV